MRWLLAALACVALVACADSPADTAAVAGIEITTVTDSLQYGDSITVAAVALDARGREIRGYGVTWSSTDTRVAVVADNGLVRGVQPGAAILVARSGAYADSMSIRVVTSACPLLDVIRMQENGYWGTHIRPGSTRYAETQSGTTEYRGVPLFWGSGLVYGTGPDTTLVGFDYRDGSSDFRAGVCNAPDASMHTVSLLRMTTAGLTPPDADVTGLMVIQDQWAFGDADNDDYVLFRYTFVNAGPEPIRNLRVGVVVDYDVYEAHTNVGGYDAVNQVASVVSRDSVTEPVTGGVILLGAAVAAYRTSSAGPSAPSRADYFAMLEPHAIDASSSAVHDVKQILGAAPFTLGPGETKSIGYALVAGETRAAFAANVGAARTRAAALW